MAPNNQQNSKAQIFQSFQQILTEKKKIESKVATKEEEAEKEKNKQILEKAANYTVDSIVKGLADLQLDFGGIINQLSEKLNAESLKLEELQKAIEIERQHLQELQKIRIVADSLHILTLEHEEKLSALEQNSALRLEALEKDMATKRKLWEKEQQEYQAAVEEQNQILMRERQEEVSDYQYEIERERKIEMDEYEETRRKLERELQESNREKDKNWQERENYLAANQAEFEENSQKAAGFEEELKQAYTKAKEDAIKSAEREAKVKTDLVAKEWESTKRGYELQVQSLEETVQRQTEQVADISAQLQEVMRQAQELAMRAFASSNNASQTNK
ncbi:MAG: hypothetical protein SXA11_24795 [Cyanobacteriota bacterium]|nr:hypothetical protein [Cyanobacteriota bacterium]